MLSFSRTLLPRLLTTSLPRQVLRTSTSTATTTTTNNQIPETKTSVEATDDTLNSEPKPDVLYRHLWIKCIGHEVQVLDSYETFMKQAAEHLDIEYVKTETPLRLIKRRTLLASRHVHKKYRVQYEFRDYYRNLLFKNLTGSTADTFLEYVERNVPEGVWLIAEKHRLAELPFDLVSPSSSSSENKDEHK